MIGPDRFQNNSTAHAADEICTIYFVHVLYMEYILEKVFKSAEVSSGYRHLDRTKHDW